jgi:hypothetical protein
VRTLAAFGVAADAELTNGSLGPELARRMASDHELLVIGAPLPGATGRRHWGDVVRVLLDSPGNFPVLVVRGTRGPVDGSWGLG